MLLVSSSFAFIYVYTRILYQKLLCDDICAFIYIYIKGFALKKKMTEMKKKKIESQLRIPHPLRMQMFSRPLHSNFLSMHYALFVL
jgi:hypothetical protein